MANSKIKGITVEIGGNTTKLDDALAKSNSKAKDLSSELRAVNNALKLDPSNVELLTKKQNLLNEQIKNTKDKLDTLKAAQEQFVKAGGDINSDAYREMEKQVIQTSTELKKLENQQSKVNAEVDSFSVKIENFGSNATSLGQKLAPLSAVSAGLITGSAVAWKEVDEAMDNVATKTGATGEKLQELQAVFKNVYGSFPTDSLEASNAVGELNTRLGFSGQELENASIQFLKFAQVNGVEVNTAVQLVTRAMGDAGIEAENYGELLDMLTTASAASGISIENLTTNITKYGAPMRQLGYDTKESIALFSQWEKAGVNTEIAFSGMKKAISNFAAAGKNAKEEMVLVMERIKSCGTLSEATTLAIETFGTKAGPDLADAIYEGRFSLEEMMEVLENSGDSLNSTFNEILDPADQAKVAFNNLKMVGAELFSTIQGMLAPVIEILVDKLQALNNWFSNLSPQIQKVIGIVLMLTAAMAPVLLIIGKLSGTIGLVIKSFNGISTIIGTLSAKFMLIVGIIAAVALAIYMLYQNSEEFRNTVNNLIQAVLPILQELLTSLYTVIMEGVMPVLQSLWQIFSDSILPILMELINIFVQYLLPILSDFVSFLAEFVLPILVTLFQWFSEYIAPIISFIAQFVLTELVNKFKFVVNIITAVINVIKTVVDWLKILWNWLKDIGVIDAFAKAFEPIKTVLDAIINCIKWIGDNAGAILGGIGDMLGGIAGAVGDFIGWLNPFDSGGFGEITRNNSITLTTNINVTNNGTPINAATLRQWGNTITDIVDENLGRRGR